MNTRSESLHITIQIAVETLNTFGTEVRRFSRSTGGAQSMLFDSGSGGGPDLIVDDGGDATQVVILCETVSKPTPIVTGENPLQVNHLPTVKPVVRAGI